MISEEDKKRIIEALEESVENHPNADDPIPGMQTQDGQPVSYRDMVEMTVKSPQFFDALEQAIDAGLTTVDDFIDSIKASTKQQNAAPKAKPSAPKMGM